MLVINDRLFTGRIGDSSVFAIVDENKSDEVKNLFEADEAESETIGLETASLCSREAFRKWQIQTLALNEIKMILLATDGFTDSLKDPLDEVKKFYLEITKKGAVGFENDLDNYLKQISQNGAGDDISLVFFLNDKKTFYQSDGVEYSRG